MWKSPLEAYTELDPKDVACVEALSLALDQGQEVVFRLEGCDLHLWDDKAEHVVRWGKGVCRAAARLGALKALNWLQQHNNPMFGSSLEDSMCVFAAVGGSVEALRWVGGPNAGWNEETCEAACQGGSLPTLKWLRHNGCRWDEKSGEAVIKRRDREMLTWLRHNRAPFTEAFAQTAARHGDLPTLTWLHQARCPYGAGVLAEAAEHGHLEILQWGRQQVLPPIPWTYTAAYRAVEHSQVQCLEFAIAHGCPWWPKHDAPAFPRNNVLMFCYKLGAPLPQYALRRVAHQTVIVTVLCLVNTGVALPAFIASDIAKVVYHELLTS